MDGLSARRSYAANMPCALLIAPPGHAGEAQRALEALGTIARPPIAPGELADQLADHVIVDVLAVEAAALDEATLDALLPDLRTLAAARRTRVVVALGPDQIDHVAGALVGTPAALLCNPTLPERVAELALRAPAPGDVGDREGQRTPGEIARLSAEVERIARTLARLTELKDSAPRGAEHKPAFDAPAPGAADIDVAAVRAAIRARRLREQFFERDLLGEPGWDILLDLFAAELEQLRVSVSSLCIAAAVPPTTALRWITGMTEAGLLERQADAADRRRAFIRLTAGASTAMRNYFAALKRQGLASG
ncbi:MAG: winged helix DNA-binding protein [Staphylococcus hominis]|nr:MAG: winged helix DNA-binding protein [Staphylococcus hominis]